MGVNTISAIAWHVCASEAGRQTHRQSGGLTQCTSLLQTHFIGDWAKVDVVACCEAGGFVYCSALAARVGVALTDSRSGQAPPAYCFGQQVSVAYLVLGIQRFRKEED